MHFLNVTPISVTASRPVLQQGRPDFGNTPSAGSFTYLLGNNKKGLKRLNPNSNHFRKGMHFNSFLIEENYCINKKKHFVHGFFLKIDPNPDDVNPYATTPIVNNQLNEMQTFGERNSQVPQVYPALKRVSTVIFNI